MINGALGSIVHTPDATPQSQALRPSGNSVIYSLAGQLPTSTSTSPGVRPHVNLIVTGFSANLGTAGSTATTVDLLKNGTAVVTLTVAAGDTYAYEQLASPLTYLARTDEYSIQVTSGTGAADLAGEIETQ